MAESASSSTQKMGAIPFLHLMSSVGPVIVDCDVGVDDAVAISLCVAHGLELTALTCVHGNTSADNIIQNTRELLRVLDKLEIPIYRGSDKCLLGSTCFAHEFHGEGGLGGVPIPVCPEETICQSEHAVMALLRMTKERPGEITLLAIGPLTNVALAIRMDPDFTKRLKRLVIMGGNTTGQGSNKRPAAEFNFFCDPEAAHVVLQEAECPVTVVPFETCYKTTLPWDWYDSLASTQSTACHFLSGVTKHSADRQKARGIAGFVMCDALAAAVLLDNAIIEEWESVPIHVERSGMYTRGQMVRLGSGPHWNEPPKDMGPNIKIVTKANAGHFKDMMSALLKL